MIVLVSKILSCVVQSQRWFCTTNGLLGASALSIVRSIEAVRISEVGICCHTFYVVKSIGATVCPLDKCFLYPRDHPLTVVLL